MGRDLSALFDPASVAVVGASDDPAKYGHAIASQVLRAPHRRPIHLVNRRGGQILGRTAASSLTEVGETVAAEMVTLPRIRIGGLILEKVTLAFAEIPPFALFGLSEQPAVLLGTDVLGAFRRVTLDFRKRKVRFLLRR